MKDTKMTSGQVHLFWYSWQVGFWNTQERLQDGSAFIYVPVKDQTYYEKRDDGRYYELNSNALVDNLPVPEEWGGAGWNDGNNQINQWLVSANAINPLTNEPYSKQYWATYKEATMTQMKKEWQEKFGAAEPAEYMKKNNALLISPNISVALPVDDNDISLIRGQCKDAVNKYSWRMIYAKTDAEFDQPWDDMVKELNGYGFEDLMEFDKEKYTIELNAKNAVK